MAALRRLYAASDLGRAIDIGTQILVDSVQVLGADHPQTLLARNNLAVVCETSGRLSEAITLHEQNLTDSERLLGGDNLRTLKTRDNLAGAYRGAGRLAEAIGPV